MSLVLWKMGKSNPLAAMGNNFAADKSQREMPGAL